MTAPSLLPLQSVHPPAVAEIHVVYSHIYGILLSFYRLITTRHLTLELVRYNVWQLLRALYFF